MISVYGSNSERTRTEDEQTRVRSAQQQISDEAGRNQLQSHNSLLRVHELRAVLIQYSQTMRHPCPSAPPSLLLAKLIKVPVKNTTSVSSINSAVHWTSQSNTNPISFQSETQSRK